MTTALADPTADGSAATGPVRLGRVDYVNVLPVYMGLEEEGSRCTLVPGVPTDLNRRLRHREIDCAPVSAIEVARSGGRYVMLPGLSISSVGAVGSSMLVSRVPPHQLEGRRVALTTHSAASLAYFRILCDRLWRVTPMTVDAEPDLQSMLTHNDACVLIGNPAIRAVDVARRRGDLHVVDLGEAWHELTGLPCVFAVWALWDDWAQAHPADVRVIHEDLSRGRDWGHDPAHRAALDARGAAETGLDRDQLHAYFDKQDYRFTADHERGLGRFLAELAALGMAPATPLRFTA